MPLTDRENYLETINFGKPEWIPCRISLSPSVKAQYRKELYKVVQKYPKFFNPHDLNEESFTNINFGPKHRKDIEFTDAWGCVWKSPMDGIAGVVIDHPLKDWSAFSKYQAPDPITNTDPVPIDWDKEKQKISRQKNKGLVTSGGLTHGFLFLRLTYLRGYENLIFDMVDEEPKLWDLIEMISKHSETLIKQWLSLDVDLIQLPEDLGTQTSSLISPAMLDKYIIPIYQRLINLCHEHGKPVVFHSDGYIMDIVKKLINSNIDVLNPQDLCNGIDALAENVKGKVAIRLDVDRQKVVPFGTPQDIFDLIEEETIKLGSPQGGLEFLAGIYPPTPLENIAGLCEAFARFEKYHW